VSVLVQRYSPTHGTAASEGAGGVRPPAEGASVHEHADTERLRRSPDTNARTTVMLSLFLEGRSHQVDGSRPSGDLSGGPARKRPGDA
jgi:hypothetical protein